MMKELQTKEIFSGVLILFLGVAVLIKSINPNDFQPNAEKWASASFDGSNIIEADEINNNRDSFKIINLDHSSSDLGLKSISIPASEILEKQNLKEIRKFKGSIVLLSEDRALASRVWMLLSQMGIRNLYILD